MKSYIQILGTGTHDSMPSVLLHFDSQRYLINCGEGTQRFCAEHKIRWSNLHKVFLTRTHWDAIGGLPGFILTVSDSGACRGLCIHGPANTTHALCSARSFLQRNEFMVDTFEFGRDGCWSIQDENITVTGVPLRKEPQDPTTATPSPASHTTTTATTADEYKEVLATMFARWTEEAATHKTTTATTATTATTTATATTAGAGTTRKAHGAPALCEPPPAKKPMRNPIAWLDGGLEARIDETAMCYVFAGRPTRRKFDVDKAKALDLPKGPLRARIVAGETVSLPDGRTIHPDDVTEPPRDGSIFLVMDVPSAAYLDSLERQVQFEPFHDQQNPMAARLQCVVHFLGKDVLELERYRAFLKKFGSHVQHILLSEDHVPHNITFPAAALQQAKLGLLDPVVYRFPYENVEPKRPLPTDLLRANVHVGKQLLRFEMEPPPCIIDRSEVNEPKIQRDLENFLASEGSEAYRASVASLASVAKSRAKSSMPSVAFLGTGSMLPSKYRNVSGILAILEKGTIIMDSGEGSYGQLYRMLGPEGMKEQLQRTKAIFISHMHADHHLGTIQILLEWRKYTPESDRLLLIGPPHLWSYLTDYARCQPLPLHRVDFVNADGMRFDQRPSPAKQQQHSHKHSALERYMRQLAISEWTTMRMDHCAHAYGVAWTTHPSSSSSEEEDGDKKPAVHMVYSGDTRPCASIPLAVEYLRERLLERGGGGDPDHCCVIHEATFEDDMQQDAILRKHSTWSEAVDVGRRSGAHELLLTHFSQRYPKLPSLPTSTTTAATTAETTTTTTTNVQEEDGTKAPISLGVAFDLMVVPVGRVPETLERYHPALSQLYKEEF